MTAPTSPILICPSCGKPNRVAPQNPLTKGRCGACQSTLSTGKPVDLTGTTLSTLLTRDTGRYVIDLWAPWCGPCRMMAPAFTEAAGHFADQVRFFKLNTEDHPQAAAQFNIRGIPTLIAYNSGQQAALQSGAMPQPQLFNWIEKSFGLMAS
ncbi:MAG: thioredoxin TrxC [Ponticaulis sp.]|nr:thioredoxin TrxC [Ponticaulis sp.]